MILTTNLLTYTNSIAEPLLQQCEQPWLALPLIKQAILDLIPTLDSSKYVCHGKDIWIEASTTIASTATITGPCIIGANCEVRPGAFLRGNVLIGDNCVIGNSTELKNVVLVGKVQVPHYNYVGDSILGYGAHFGAGSITSNVKADRSLVIVNDGTDIYETNLKKFGAIVGDYVEIGCNAVLNPGTVVGRRSSIYPVVSVRGVIPADCIVKASDVIVKRK